MHIITREFIAEFEAKKSKFIAHLTPFAAPSELAARRAALAAAHPKAAHIVWAYRYLNEFAQVVENASDDGEPKGSSGASVLAALRGGGLVGAGALVVRYFGGVKLGIGGLVRAYGAATNAALGAARAGGGVREFVARGAAAFFVPFALVAKVEHFLGKMGASLGANSGVASGANSNLSAAGGDFGGSFGGGFGGSGATFSREFGADGAEFIAWVTADERAELAAFLGGLNLRFRGD